MKYKIKSFVLGVKEARWISCTTVYGRPARIAYDMGRKLSNGFTALLKVRLRPIEGANGITKATKGRSRRRPEEAQRFDSRTVRKCH
ncbi:MAG: hypothetical protein DMF22_11680 [Verrucomicrobia bacterium]|nr:MAG: hypothetical protein DMF22_11680 [Verrucomicrobiota bacterium]